MPHSDRKPDSVSTSARLSTSGVGCCAGCGGGGGHGCSSAFACCCDSADRAARPVRLVLRLLL